MEFTFTRAIMKLKKVYPIKFKSNWNNESKEICTKSKFNSDYDSSLHINIFGITFDSNVQLRRFKLVGKLT